MTTDPPTRETGSETLGEVLGKANAPPGEADSAHKHVKRELVLARPPVISPPIHCLPALAQYLSSRVTVRDHSTGPFLPGGASTPRT